MIREPFMASSERTNDFTTRYMDTRFTLSESAKAASLDSISDPSMKSPAFRTRTLGRKPAATHDVWSFSISSRDARSQVR